MEPIFVFNNSAAQAKIIEKSKDPVKYLSYSEEWANRVTALLGRLDTAKLHVVASDCTFQLPYSHLKLADLTLSRPPSIFFTLQQALDFAV